MTRTALLARPAVALAAVLLAGCGAETDAEDERSAAPSAPPQAEQAQAVLDAAVRKQLALNEGAFAVRVLDGEPKGNEGVVTAVLWDRSLGVAAATFTTEADGPTQVRVVDDAVWTTVLSEGGRVSGCWSRTDAAGTFAARPGSDEVDPGWPLADLFEASKATELSNDDGQVVTVQVPARVAVALVLGAVRPIELEGERADEPVEARVAIYSGRLDHVEIDPEVLGDTGDAAVDRLARSAAEDGLDFRIEINPTAENLRVAAPQPACR